MRKTFGIDDVARSAPSRILKKTPSRIFSHKVICHAHVSITALPHLKRTTTLFLNTCIIAMKFGSILLLLTVITGSDGFLNPRPRGVGGGVVLGAVRISNSVPAVIAVSSSHEPNHAIVATDDDLAASIGNWEYQHEYLPVYDTVASATSDTDGTYKKITRSTLHLIHRMAKRMSKGQSEMEDDLIQEGIIALMEAMHHYPMLSHKVVPLEQYVKRHVLAEMNKSLEGSLLFHEQRRQQQTQQPLASLTRRIPSDFPVAVSSGRGTLEMMNPLSSAAPTSWIRSDSLMDLDELTPEGQVLQAMIRSDVSTACEEILNDMERQVIQSHFGLDQPEAALSWREMAKRWKTTPQFLQSITSQALTKLRRHSVGDEWLRSS